MAFRSNCRDMVGLRFVGVLFRAIATGSQGRIQGVSLGFHANVAVMAEHLTVHMTRNVHDGLVTGSTLGELRNQRVSIVMPASLHLCSLADRLPCGFERGHMACRVRGPGLAEG